MEKRKVLFRGDGNSETGLGHLYRLFALVEIYKTRYDFVFLTKKSSTLSIFPENYNVELIPNSISIIEEPEWLSINYSPSEYFVIADGYQFKPEYQKEIKNLDYYLIYIDDLFYKNIPADIIVNHSPNVYPDDYKNKMATKFAFGTNYAILRPSFLGLAKEQREISTIHTAFVCFGGADMLDLSLKAVRALLRVNNITEIHVVLGGAYVHKTIFSLEKLNKKLQLYRNLGGVELAELMQKCEFAIAPSSTILYELCAVKMPILSGYFVENQKNIYNALSQIGAIAKGGNFKNYTEEDFYKKIVEIIKAGNYKAFISIQKNLIDGNSHNRFLSLLENVDITFEKASEKHMMQVYEWSNDSRVRENSYNTEEITLNDHKRWYLKKINSKT
ncbi:UDP-2,4-diacetamido-2,4,6-trideoxy-beta-L-altropyranose hydrolase, partial [Maribacter sp.]|uniref:UDP-2,4-diacetamido-2,4, 6-trideoxy-beta-L-altropyranose hydrolase n=1 Tax=Maribacter sp. TaxID=1897614 RepID=UPI0025C54111